MYMPVTVLMHVLVFMSMDVRPVTAPPPGRGKPLPNNIVPNEYFVSIHSVDGGVAANQQAMNEFRQKVQASDGLKLHGQRFRKFNLFFVEGSQESVGPLRRYSEVRYVEANMHVTLAGCQTDTVSNTWGLDRIDQRGPVSSASSGQYVHGNSDDDGSGVTAYVVDTGVDVNLAEFEGRATWGFTAKSMGRDKDQHGHGTHVAGTIGSKTYGVAKKVNIVAVKVLNMAGGTTQSVISGLEFVESDVLSKGTRGVVNMSLGGGASQTLDEAVQDLVDSGITVVVSAGNGDVSSCTVSPAGAPNAITVGGTDSSEVQHGSWGNCVDIHAPGWGVKSLKPKRGTTTMSGTSMATPHVTGVVARYLSTRSPSDTVTVSDVTDWLLDMATTGALPASGDFSKSPNTMLYINCFQSGGWDFE